MSRRRLEPPPLWKQRRELRELAERLAHVRRVTLSYLEGEDPIGVLMARADVEAHLRAVEAAGWRPPPATINTARQLAAAGPGSVVTASDNTTWVSGPTGAWYGPAGANASSAERRRPLTVRHHEPQPAAADSQGAA